MSLSAKSIRPPVAFYVAIIGLIALGVSVAVAKLTGTHAAGVRYFGIFMGALMVVAGNALPKLLRPGEASRPAERLAGWTFVLGGLLIIGLWLWAPEASRILVTSIAGLATFATVLLTTLLMTRSAPAGRSVSPDMPEIGNAAMSRQILLHILHAVMWVFAMFLVAELWNSKNTIAWLAVGFTVSQGILSTCLAAPWRALRKTSE